MDLLMVPALLLKVHSLPWPPEWPIHSGGQGRPPLRLFTSSSLRVSSRDSEEESQACEMYIGV